MAFQRLCLFLGIVAFLFLNACNLIDGGKNGNGVVVCDLFVKYNSGDKTLQVNATFFMEDSLGKIPYFLDEPVFLNEAEMQKKLTPGKGLSYDGKLSVQNKHGIFFSFKDINGELHRKEIETWALELGDICPIHEGKVIEVPSKKDVSLVLFDSSKKMLEFSSGGTNKILVDKNLANMDGDGIMPIFIQKERTKEQRKGLEIRYRYESVEPHGICKIRR